MTGRLEGKVAFITGAARGQGRAHAVRLAEEGAEIIATDLGSPTEDGEFAKTVELVEATGRRIIACAADVRDLDALSTVVSEGVDELGRLDVVVANAGVVATGPALETSEEDWKLTIDVNLSGAWYTCKASLPHLLEGARGGSIVITSSTLGLKATRGVVAYAASKHGVVGLMKALAIEFAPHMIRVNSLHPTTVDTPMLRSLWPPGLSEEEVKEVFTHTNALPVAWLEPEDVSDAVVFLASDEARYITGVALPVDAGSLLVSGSPPAGPPVRTAV
jgi:SDR family mycofactocin-dependent oxidoreductase